MQAPRTIICAVADDMPAGVIEASRWLAEGIGGSVVLAHVFDAMGIPAATAQELAAIGRTSDELAEEERAHLRARLQNAASGLSGVPHTTALADGLPVPELLRLAAEHRARLLVTGTAAHGTLDRVLVGSVSSELAARAPCPVVAVPAGAAIGATGPVVAGYDGSADGLHAAREAAALAVLLERELVLVCVTEGDAEHARAEIERDRDLYTAVSVVRPPASMVVAGGDPAGGLADVAREREAALLVTGTRGRGAVASAFLGSVSAGVVRRAGRPVVLVGPSAPP